MQNGHRAILRQFLADGMDHMFGNPGTVEQGFLDALSDFPEFRYGLTLQERVAVMAAEGYARRELFYRRAFGAPAGEPRPADTR